MRLKGVAGCSVVPDGHPDKMAAAISQVLEKRERTNGREAVRELDENLLAQRMIEIYRKAIATKDAAPRRTRSIELINNEGK